MYLLEIHNMQLSFKKTLHFCTPYLSKIVRAVPFKVELEIS